MLSDSSLFDLFGDSRKPAQSGTFNPFAELHYLVIDDMDAARQSLKNTIQAMGGFHIDVAHSYTDAASRLRKQLPDVILCDYILGSGRDGQQLLEQLRRNDVIPESIAFIMVTTESGYEQVVSAAELIPDDYITNPFTPEMLRNRMERILRKKIFFRHYYNMKAEGRLDDAVAELDMISGFAKAKAYRIELMRYRTETLVAAQRYDDAIDRYREILDIHPFPWAKAGLARVFKLKHQLDEARNEIDEVIKIAPNYFEAYDLKANICCEMGDFAEAQETLSRAAAQTPRNYVRKRTLSNVAALNGDFETAISVMNEVLTHDKIGDISIQDRLTLGRASIENGACMAARTVLEEIPENQLKAAAEDEKTDYECLMAICESDSEAGRTRFERLRLNLMQKTSPGVDLGLDVIRVALVYVDVQLADKVATRLLEDNEDNGTVNAILSVYRNKDKEWHFRDLQEVVASRNK